MKQMISLLSSQSNIEVRTYHRNSLDEFLEERRLSSFHFLLPFLSGLGFNSSHLSSEPIVTGDSNNITKNQTSETWKNKVMSFQICP